MAGCLAGWRNLYPTWRECRAGDVAVVAQPKVDFSRPAAGVAFVGLACTAVTLGCCHSVVHVQRLM